MPIDGPHILDQFDPRILSRALQLIRDRYGSAEKSVFFLELYAGVSAINSGIANQRDCFSHLVTLLKNPHFTSEQQLEQIASMEEHLRRAVLEPPFIAVVKLWERFEPVYAQYKELVLTLPERPKELPGAPNVEIVNERIAAILQLQEKARTGKGENRWDTAWELAVAEAVSAFTHLSTLKAELEGHIAEARRIRESRTDSLTARRQMWIGIAIGGSISLGGGALFYFLSR